MSKDVYISVEPLKLSEKVRMDIQSLLNLWTLFGPEQYIDWAQTGIQSYIDDLVNGRVTDWLDDFNELTASDYSETCWTLQKTIYQNLDYR